MIITMSSFHPTTAGWKCMLHSIRLMLHELLFLFLLISVFFLLWERIFEHRLRGVINVTENQFGFMPGRSTMEVIFLIRQLMERCREQKKDLHMDFIDLEKAYDKVPRNVMWWALQKHKVSTKYITLIKDMYDNIVISVRTSDGDTNDFPINIGMYQGSAIYLLW
jgi:hypothetical protein